MATPVIIESGSVTLSGIISVTQSGTWNINDISGSISLPTGASTAAKQDTGNTSLASIDGKITAVNTGAVVIASGTLTGITNPVAVTGTFWQATQPVSIAGTVAVSAISLPLPSGASTSALQTQPGVDIGDVTVNNASGGSAVNIQDGGNSITVDGTVAVTGSVTANAGTNLNTSLLALETGGNLATLTAKDFATQTTLAALNAKVTAVNTGAVVISSGTITSITNPVAVTQSGTWNVGTLTSITNPVAVTGTFWQATQPVSAVSLPLPSNAAQETGGNLASLVAKDFATSAKQDTGNTSLATIAAKDFATQTTLALIKAKTDNLDVASSTLATQASLATVVTNTAPIATAQAATSSGVLGPMVQGVVSDVPNSFSIDTVQPLSLTAEGRLRVSAVMSQIDQVWQHTFDNPWYADDIFLESKGELYV